MIMKDEKYFNNPEKFDPENFSPERKAKRSPYAFLAFGQGPRNCVGMRFALLQVNILLSYTKFTASVSTALSSSVIEVYRMQIHEHKNVFAQYLHHLHV